MCTVRFPEWKCTRRFVPRQWNISAYFQDQLLPLFCGQTRESYTVLSSDHSDPSVASLQWFCIHTARSNQHTWRADGFNTQFTPWLKEVRAVYRGGRWAGHVLHMEPQTYCLTVVFFWKMIELNKVSSLSLRVNYYPDLYVYSRNFAHMYSTRRKRWIFWRTFSAMALRSRINQVGVLTDAPTSMWQCADV